MNEAPSNAPKENWRILKNQNLFQFPSSPIFSERFMKMRQMPITRRLAPSQRLSIRESILFKVNESKTKPNNKKNAENFLSLSSYQLFKFSILSFILSPFLDKGRAGMDLTYQI